MQHQILMKLFLDTKDSLRYHGRINQEKQGIFPKGEVREKQMHRELLGSREEEGAPGSRGLESSQWLLSSISPCLLLFLSSLPPLPWRSPTTIWERKLRGPLTFIRTQDHMRSSKVLMFLLSYFLSCSLL